jgi:SAM-dependent methyltransferase
MKELGTKEYFQEVTQRKYFVEKHILNFAKFDAYKGKTVLEVGCGLGTAAQSFMEAGAIYTGIDISPRSIELAKKRIDVFQLTGDVRVADIQFDEFDSGHYDLVYSFGVLHHIPDLGAALQNIYNALKPGGEFKLMMYAENSWKKACIDSGLDQFEAQSGVPIAHTYTNEQITELLTCHKFIGIEIKQDHIFQWSIPEYKNYEYKKEPWFEAMPDELLRTMEKRFGWHLLITCHKPLAER